MQIPTHSTIKVVVEKKKKAMSKSDYLRLSVNRHAIMFSRLTVAAG